MEATRAALAYAATPRAAPARLEQGARTRQSPARVQPPESCSGVCYDSCQHGRPRAVASSAGAPSACTVQMTRTFAILCRTGQDQLATGQDLMPHDALGPARKPPRACGRLPQRQPPPPRPRRPPRAPPRTPRGTARRGTAPGPAGSSSSSTVAAVCSLGSSAGSCTSSCARVRC